MIRCVYCNRRIYLDAEDDWVHFHLRDLGVDDRMCQPDNPDSEIAKPKGVKDA